MPTYDESKLYAWLNAYDRYAEMHQFYFDCWACGYEYRDVAQAVFDAAGRWSDAVNEIIGF